MQLKRMYKVTVVADRSQQEHLVNKLTEWGIRYFHVLECPVQKYGVGLGGEELTSWHIQLELLVDFGLAEAVLQSLTDEGATPVQRAITVSEVLASPDFREVGGRGSAHAHQDKWGDYVITL